MFKNPIMEALSVSGPKMMIPFHIIIASLVFYRGVLVYATGEYLTFVGIFVAGFFFWTFAEYLLHRYVFHFVNDSKVVQKIHYAMHGYHHSVPKDSNRLFMPPVPALLLLGSFFGIFYLFMGKAAWFFLPGFEIGYLFYALMHYSIHTIRANNAPKFIRPLWIHHSLHHHKYPDLAFGVSNRFWDRVFGTMPPMK